MDHPTASTSPSASRSPDPADQPDRPDQPDQRLALIELQGRDGRSARAVGVHRWPLRLGRALDNDIVLDDPHVAAHHARIGPDEHGQLLLTALPSLNGVNLGPQRVAGSVPVPAGGAVLTLGSTRLRLRLAAETLAPEIALGGPGLGPAALGLCALLLLALQLGSHWLSLDPGADTAAWLPTLVTLPLALAAWCGAWALMSKVFQHRFDFNGHLRIALPWLLALFALDLLWPQATAALATPRLWMLSQALQAVVGALLIRAHLAHVLPLHARAATAAVVAMALAAGAISLARTWRGTDSFSTEPYMSTLPLPALRLAGTVPSALLVQEMAPLAGALAQRVKKAKEEDDEDSSEAASE